MGNNTSRYVKFFAKEYSGFPSFLPLGADILIERYEIRRRNILSRALEANSRLYENLIIPSTESLESRLVQFTDLCKYLSNNLILLRSHYKVFLSLDIKYMIIYMMEVNDYRFESVTLRFDCIFDDIDNINNQMIEASLL